MDESMNGLQFPNNNISTQIVNQQISNNLTGSIIDINSVIQLVNSLYNSNNPGEQNEANRQLTELQVSNEAWNVCWLLLDPTQNYPNEVHFFAANLLALKINQSWAELEEVWLEKELRPKLFDILVKYSSSPSGTKLVLDRLALALANFALHSIPTFWPDAIEDILNTFTNSNLPVNISRDKVRDILLRILTFIPEEYSVMLPQMELRAKLNERMSKSGHMIFRFLHTLLMDPSNIADSTDSKQNIFKCLTSWTLHSHTTLLEIEDGKSLLDRLYDLILDEELCGPACSTLGASFSSPKADNYRNSIIDFVPKIAGLKGAIQKYLADEEMECAIKIYSLVINFSENHSRLLLRIVLEDSIQLEGQRLAEMKQAVFEIIKIILECTAAPGIFGLDEKYSDIAFPFWFSFFENFYYYTDGYTETICDLFDPLVDSLIQILVTKAQYPPTVTFNQIWDDDKRESYRCYRQDLGDNISLIATFPKAKGRILAQLTEQMTSELSNMLQYQTRISEEKPWQSLEAVLFGLKSICETIPFDENEHVPKIFNLIGQIPYNESQKELYCTVSELISSYSDWLFTHSSHLATAFTILFLGVTSPDAHVRLMSTLSLKDLTNECQTVLKPFATQIVKSCTDAISQTSQPLNTNEKSRLMHTIGTTLAVTSSENAATSLSTLTIPIICDLNVKARANPTEDENCRHVILDRLTMLNNLIEALYVKHYSGNDYESYTDENDYPLIDTSRSDTPQHEVAAVQPTIGLIKELIPILGLIADKYRADEDVMSKISDTIRRSSKSLGLELRPIVHDLVSLLVNAYDPLVNPFILEGLVPLFFIFRLDKTISDFFRDALARISDRTMEVCLRNPLRSLSSTVEHFFKFVTCVYKKYPEFLIEHPSPINIEYIYKLALASLELPEKRTLCEVCSFLSLYRQKGIDKAHLHGIFVSHLELLINNVFNIFGGNYATPRNAIEPVIDMLFFVVDATEVKQPLQEVVRRENFPTQHVSSDQKARFVSKIVLERNRRKYKDICNEFVLAVRNLNRKV